MPELSRIAITKLPLAACLAAMSVATVSCGKAPESSASRRVSQPAVPVAEGVSIEGRVTLAGGLPSGLGKIIDVLGNPFCSQHGALIDPTWKVSADGGLADAVVIVRDGPVASNVSAEPVLVDQKDCLFVPSMTAIQAGQAVRFRNSDLTFHNVRIVRHEPGTENRGENIDNYAQPSMGGENVRTFAEPGIYRIECDVHRWMRAWVRVCDGIHFARSNGNGHFQINRALADGEYTVEAWHPQFEKPVVKTVALRNGKCSVGFEFELATAFRP